MSTIAERIVHHMLGLEPLLEDRIDDLLKKYGGIIPGTTPESKRQTLETWASYDPSRQKKYFPWYFKQFVERKLKMDGLTLDHLRDLLMSFEHYITMPQFKAPRDIYQYDYKSLEKVVRENEGLMSKRDIKRGKENLGGQVLNTIGNLDLVGFKDGNSLAKEAWRAYSPENPDWKGKPVTPDMPDYRKGYPDYPPGTTEPYSVDHLWCIRKPSRGADYIKGAPSKMFYVIRKNGFPYVGIVMGSYGSQIVNTDNHQIDAGVTEEIYDVFKPILDEYAKNKWDVGHAASSLFGKLRIIRGELKPGETISGSDLSNSSLKYLPDDLTVTGDLNVSGTKLKALPRNLNVQGSLYLANTNIKELPAGLQVKGNLGLSGTKITSLPDGMTVGNLDISNTPISKLPNKLKVTESLRINGTGITVLPNDMVVTKVYYSPDKISESEIRRYFFWLRHDDLKKHFWKSSQVQRMTDEQKEEAWSKFQNELIQHFQKADTIKQAVSSMFEPVREAKPEASKRRR